MICFVLQSLSQRRLALQRSDSGQASTRPRAAGRTVERAGSAGGQRQAAAICRRAQMQPPGGSQKYVAEGQLTFANQLDLNSSSNSSSNISNRPQPHTELRRTKVSVGDGRLTKIVSECPL